MSYTVVIRSSFKKDYKKFKGKMKKSITDILTQIQGNPNLGSVLSNNMDGFLKFRFNNSPQYRILYTVYNCPNPTALQNCIYKDACSDASISDCEGIIDFVLIKTREEMNNLYNKKKKYYDNFKRKPNISKGQRKA